MIDEATMEGVHVAALPVTMSNTSLPGGFHAAKKWLTSEDAVLSVVREYCPIRRPATA